MTARVSTLAFVAFTISATRFPTTTRLPDELFGAENRETLRQIGRINGLAAADGLSNMSVRLTYPKQTRGNPRCERNDL